MSKACHNILLLSAAIIFLAACICASSIYADAGSGPAVGPPASVETAPAVLCVPAGEHDPSPYVEAYMENRYGRDFYVIGRMTENDIGGQRYTLRVSGDKYGRSIHVTLVAVKGGYTVRDDYMPAHVATAYKNVLTGLCARYFEGARASILVQAHPEGNAAPDEALSQRAECWITLQDDEMTDAKFAEFYRTAYEFFAAFNQETAFRFVTGGGNVVYLVKGGTLQIVKTTRSITHD